MTRLLRDDRAAVLLTGLLILGAMAWSSMEWRTPVSQAEIRKPPETQPQAKPQPKKPEPAKRAKITSATQIILPPPPSMPAPKVTAMAAKPTVTPREVTSVKAPRNPLAIAPAPTPSRPKITALKKSEAPAAKPKVAPMQRRTLAPSPRKRAIKKPVTKRPLKAIQSSAITAMKTERTPTKPTPRKTAPAPESTPRKRASEAPSPAVVQVDAKAERKGRPLLRLLEHGKGPDLQIGWPASSTERDRLYRLLRSCHAMRPAIMRGDALYIEGGRSGGRWAPNMDRYSGFVRSPDGELQVVERDLLNTVRRQHGIAGGKPMRLFPRRFDAMLLGGLDRLMGGAYANTGSIQANYGIEGGQVVVSNLVADGRRIEGSITIPSSRGCAGGRV